MSADFDPTLPTDKDWVRLVIGDTDTSNAIFTDESIQAFVDEEANKKLAAARCLEALVSRWGVESGGLTEKQTSKLRRRWGGTGSTIESMGKYAETLRAEGAEETFGTTPFLEAM